MKISIITTTFNSEKTIRDTLDSVLIQNYHNYELIIKDGGSKDNTLEICESYKEKFARFSHKGATYRIISAPDSNLYDAMNQGISMATGDIIGILNSDDFFTSEDILKNIADEFSSHPDIEAVYGDVHYVNPSNIQLPVRYYSSHIFNRSLMRLGFMPAHPSFYCKKSTYERYKLDGNNIPNFRGDVTCAYFNTSYKIAADFENLLRLIFVHRIKIHYIPKDFVTMRTGGVSTSGISSHIQIMRDHLRAFKDNQVYTNHLLLSLRYFYKILEIIFSKK